MAAIDSCKGRIKRHIWFRQKRMLTRSKTGMQDARRDWKCPIRKLSAFDRGPLLRLEPPPLLGAGEWCRCSLT